MLPKHVARILVKLGAVTLSPDKPYTFASGIKSPIYCDNRILLSHPKERNEIVQGFLDVIETHGLHCDVVAGTATAGIAWAAWVADRLGRPMIYVREAAKGHGRRSQIEGEFKPGATVIVIEDLVSTGGNVLGAVKAIRKAGGEVSHCLSIFTYQLDIARLSFAGEKISAVALTHFTELVELACEQGVISDRQLRLVLAWRRDPKGWLGT